MDWSHTLILKKAKTYSLRIKKLWKPSCTKSKKLSSEHKSDFRSCIASGKAERFIDS